MLSFVVHRTLMPSDILLHRHRNQRIDFSDPHGGKGAADRLAATCKNQVRTFLNEGNDVTNAEQLKSALLSHGGVEGVRVAVMQSSEEEAIVDDNRKIIGINK